MDRLKTFGKYVAIIVAFWIFSEVLIYFAFDRRISKETSEDNVINNVDTVQNNVDL